MLSAGVDYPLGASLGESGINFALHAPSATRVELCLFDATGQTEIQRWDMPHCTHGTWHGLLPQSHGGTAGLVYGYRVYGPWNPAQGQRFNPAKLLLDPYAREVLGHYDGGDIHCGHQPGKLNERDERDNAALALKGKVLAPLPPLTVPAPCIDAGKRVLYELHVKAQTKLHPQVPEALRGTYAGLAHPAVLDHIQSLGVTTLSLMPVHHRVDESRLQALGLSNHWGYNTIGWFAPEARYWSGTPGTSPAAEFRALVDAVHARGMEVVIDVVYNHSAETDEFGPTLSLRGIDNALYYHLRDNNKALYENWSGCGNCLNLNQPAVLQLVMDSLRYWVTEMGVDGFRFDLAPILARRDLVDKGFDSRAALFVAINQDPVCRNKLFIAEPWDMGPGGYQLGAFPPGWLEWNDRYRDTVRRYWLSAEANRGELAHALAASSHQFNHNHRRPSASVNFITAHDGFTLRDLVSHRLRHNMANGEHNRDGHGNNHSTNCGVEGETDDPVVLAKRRALQKAMLSTLLLSQGTPMLLAGDEMGQSQRGNNNAYCQDNEITWLDWAQADSDLSEHVRQLLAKRMRIAALTQDRWWVGESDVRWRDAQGQVLSHEAWHDLDERGLWVEWGDGVRWSAEPDLLL